MPLAFGADSVTWSTHGPARPGSEPPPAACKTPLNTCTRKRAQHSWRRRHGGAPGRNQPGGPPNGRMTILRPTFHSATLIGVARISCRRGRDSGATLRRTKVAGRGLGRPWRTAAPRRCAEPRRRQPSAAPVARDCGHEEATRAATSMRKAAADEGRVPRGAPQASPAGRPPDRDTDRAWHLACRPSNGRERGRQRPESPPRGLPGSKLRNLRRVGRAPESVSSSSQGTGPSPRWGVKCGNVESG